MPLQDLLVSCDATTGQVCSAKLYGEELLGAANPCRSELWVNGEPLPPRPHSDPSDPTRKIAEGGKGDILLSSSAPAGGGEVEYPLLPVRTPVRVLQSEPGEIYCVAGVSLCAPGAIQKAR
jgi:hypothetical protein